ncbi:MAG: glycosyltransferase family 2 protein [Leptolyngbyaceae cyanobacterium T60_A2020_046]|nr:glycosyltransferase family 2 protein [Leptolyngbyaceae cyanobacterium T60_A2020_046]
MENQRVALIIPVHNRREITLSCLSQLRRDRIFEWATVIVVDDGSTDGTRAAIRADYPEVMVLEGDGHLWWTGAIALGMEYAVAAGAEFLIWLNDDCLVSAAAIADLVEFCRTTPKAIVGGQGYEKSDPTRLSFGGKRKTWRGFRFIEAPEESVISCDLLSGNLVCFPRAVIEQIGYPDMTTAPHYAGDSLYLLKAQRCGFHLFVDGRHSVYNTTGESRLCPSDWLMTPGDPWQLIRLVFNPYSGLSWRVWWQINRQAYGLWGVVMFLKKYASIVPLTILRCLPGGWRYRIFRQEKVGG